MRLMVESTKPVVVGSSIPLKPAAKAPISKPVSRAMLSSKAAVVAGVARRPAGISNPKIFRNKWQKYKLDRSQQFWRHYQ